MTMEPTQAAPQSLAPIDPRTLAVATASDAAPRRRLAAVLRRPLFLVGLSILVFWIAMAIGWRLVVPFQPDDIDPAATLTGPSATHWFGTDNLGRDVLSRVLAGSSTVLVTAPLATAVGVAAGVLIGLVAGYFRGVIDEVLMRLVDALLSFPLIILAALVLAALGSSTLNVILVIGVVFAPIVARTVRAAVLAERDREYVRAARLRGQGHASILVTEILPNIREPLVVETTVRFGYAVFTSATLSFLTLGVQQPSPDWGLTISLGRNYLQVAPWMVLFPAAALATLVVAINLLAEGVRDAADR